MAVLWKPYLSKVKRISLCVDIRLSPELKWLQQLFSRHALGHGSSQHVENSGHTDRRGRRISYHYRKEIWSLSQLCSLSHPLHSSLHHTPPLEGLSTPLVMTMLQTTLLSLGALPEPRCNSAKEKKKSHDSSQRLGERVEFFGGNWQCVELGSLKAHPSPA